MRYNYKNSLSICHGFHVTSFMSQQFSIALIIEFMETVKTRRYGKAIWNTQLCTSNIIAT